MSSPESLLTFDQARTLVESHAREVAPPASEDGRLLDSLGRVLAEDLQADRDFPPFPRATRDGYALRAADVQQVPCTLQMVGQIKAGDSPTLVVGPGQCMEIMTGAPAPHGADAVVMVEFTSSPNQNKVEIRRAVVAGENVVAAASEAHAGETLVTRGTRMSFRQIALAAAIGKAYVRLFRKPRIAILPTGDELVELSAQPSSAQIRNSNSYSLAAQVSAAGGHPVLLPIAPDERGRLSELIHRGLQSDLLLLSGGVSMGKYDLVKEALKEFGAQFFFTGVSIQPGKPVIFGRAYAGRETFFFGLPGNPISTMVTFELFARPLVEALSGASPQALPFMQARLNKAFRAKSGLSRFLPAILTHHAQQAAVELVAWQGSGDVAAIARANCFLVVPPDREALEAGETVTVLLR